MVKTTRGQVVPIFYAQSAGIEDETCCHIRAQKLTHLAGEMAEIGPRKCNSRSVTSAG